MNDAHLRPRSVSEIVDAAFVLYRKHAARYMVVAAIGAVPLLVVQLLFADSMVVDPSDPNSVGSVLGMQMIENVISFITYAIIGAFVIALGSQAYLGHEPEIGAALRTVMPRIPTLLVASIMKGVLYVIGAFMLLIGMLYFLARYFAVEPAIVLENKAVGESFTRSSVLSKGRKRHILNTLLLVGIVYLVLAFGVGFIAGAVGSTVVLMLVSTLVTVIALPVFQLTVMLLYYDARIRSEGFDLEHMAAALDAPAPARS